MTTDVSGACPGPSAVRLSLESGRTERVKAAQRRVRMVVDAVLPGMSVTEAMAFTDWLHGYAANKAGYGSPAPGESEGELVLVLNDIDGE